MKNDQISSLIHLYEDGALSRRELLTRLTKYTGSAAAAVAVMESAGLAQTTSPACPADVRVTESDPSVISQPVTLHGEGGPIFAYLSSPRGQGAALPAVVVIHENRGLNDHIKDVNRRVAKAGFVALAPDLLSRQGGTDQFTDPEAAVAAYNQTQPEERREDLRSALLTIADQPYVQGDRVGTVGFCAGGGNVFDLAVNTDRLAAAVVFYGPPPNPIEQISNLTAPLLGIFAELDRGINSRVPSLMTVLNDARKPYELHIYENTNHAFHNDTGARYDAAAACDAWQKTIAFFNRHLNRAAA
jgi:carboxymethylenebutenolidase